MAGVKKGIF